MLSFVWGRAGSTIKSRGRMFASASLNITTSLLLALGLTVLAYLLSLPP
jgi:hypothetical protein